MKTQLPELSVVCGKHLKGIQLKFLTVDLNVGIRLKCIFIKFDFFRVAVFKKLQFKIANFRLNKCCHFASVATEDHLLESWLTFLENHEHAVTI